MEPAEDPDEKDDRDGYADQPQQNGPQTLAVSQMGHFRRIDLLSILAACLLCSDTLQRFAAAFAVPNNLAADGASACSAGPRIAPLFRGLYPGGPDHSDSLGGDVVRFDREPSTASNWAGSELDFLIRTQWLAEGEACDRRAVEQLRRPRWTGKQIATETGVSPAP